MQRRKNICITINSLNRGGAEKQCLLLAKALKDQHNVKVIILNDKPVHDPHISFIQQEKIEHIFLPANFVLKPLAMARILRTDKVDIIFSFLPTDSLLSAIIGRLCGVPYVVGGIRNSFLTRYKFLGLKWANNLLLNYTIANNYAAHRAANTLGFKNKVFVISNGIEVRAVPQKVIVEKETVSIISLGRLVEQKRYDVALSSILSLKNILKDSIQLKYRIVGQGPKEEEIEASIRALKLENEVELITKPDDIFELLLQSDIYLCTSSFEGVSNAIMEAMNCHLPIVATDAGDNARLVLHEINGFITEIGDVEEISNALKEIIFSPSMRERMGMRGYEHLIRNFSYETFKNNYLNFIAHIDEIKIIDGTIYLLGQKH